MGSLWHILTILKAVEAYGRQRGNTLARILVVDGDFRYRRAVRIALTVRGYEVPEAANGLEALDETRIEATDVILMDWVMPGMGGDAACRAIRTASSVPIIVVTALDREREALAAGADVFLQKPVSIHTLQAGIEAILGARGTHRE